MRDGAILSGLLHGVIILLLLVGLPHVFRRELEPPPIIPIEIVNIADLTQAPAPKVKPKDETPIKEVKKEKPTPPKPTPVVEEIIEPTPEPEKPEPIVLHTLQDRLMQKLGVKVSVTQNAQGRGKLTIRYRNEKELENILTRLH